MVGRVPEVTSLHRRATATLQHLSRYASSKPSPHCADGPVIATRRKQHEPRTMDVDARERRPGGGRRGSHAARRRAKRPASAQPGRGPVTDQPAALQAVEERQARAKRNVAYIKLICLHSPAIARPVGRPWPRQVDWRSFLGVRARNLF
jgi:hypothetical protein